MNGTRTGYTSRTMIDVYRIDHLTPAERGELAAFEENLNREGWMGNEAAFAERARHAGFGFR